MKEEEVRAASLLHVAGFLLTRSSSSSSSSSCTCVWSFAAAHPLARLAHEYVEASALVYHHKARSATPIMSNTHDDVDDALTSRLAAAGTPLSTWQTKVFGGDGSLCGGTRLGKLFTGLVILPASSSQQQQQQPYLFAPTTATRGMLCLPEAAQFDVEHHLDDARPYIHEDHLRGDHVPKTATTTYLASLIDRGDEDDDDDEDERIHVMRYVVLGDEIALHSSMMMMCGWWLRRPIAHTAIHAMMNVMMKRPQRTRELSRRTLHAPLIVKMAADVFQPPPVLQRVMRGTCAIAARTTTWMPEELQENIHARLARISARVGGPSSSPSLRTSPDGSTSSLSTWVWRWLSWWTIIVMMSLGAVSCILPRINVGATTHVAAVLHNNVASTNGDDDDDDDADDDAYRWMHQLGHHYGGGWIAALDVSHTSLRAEHVLAYVDGAERSSSLTGPTTLRALDLAGCQELHHPCTSRTAQRCAMKLLREEGVEVLDDDDDDVPRTCVVGVALAALSAHGLRWLAASGASLTNDAMWWLGHCTLMNVVRQTLLEQHSSCVPRQIISARRGGARKVELLLSTPSPSSSSSSSSSSATVAISSRRCATSALMAMDLMCCVRITDVNALAYLPALRQLLLSFSGVDDVGIQHLHGSLLPEFGVCTSDKKSDDDHGDVVRIQPHDLAALRALVQQRCAGHLYHLDLSSCTNIEDVHHVLLLNTLEYINVSQTRVRELGWSNSSSTTQVSHHPLRVVIAELCDVVHHLNGLAQLTRLQRLYVRSGGLAEDGLRVFARTNSSVEVLNLSYSDKIHCVSCLASLTSLRVLILDSTELTPDGVRGLQEHCATMLLHVSLLDCPDLLPPSLPSEANQAQRRHAHEELAGQAWPPSVTLRL